jgi:hypothetical protein
MFLSIENFLNKKYTINMLSIDDYSTAKEMAERWGGYRQDGHPLLRPESDSGCCQKRQSLAHPDKY